MNLKSTSITVMKNVNAEYFLMFSDPKIGRIRFCNLNNTLLFHATDLSELFGTKDSKFICNNVSNNNSVFIKHGDIDRLQLVSRADIKSGGVDVDCVTFKYSPSGSWFVTADGIKEFLSSQKRYSDRGINAKNWITNKVLPAVCEINSKLSNKHVSNVIKHSDVTVDNKVDVKATNTVSNMVPNTVSNMIPNTVPLSREEMALFYSHMMTGFTEQASLLKNQANIVSKAIAETNTVISSIADMFKEYLKNSSDVKNLAKNIIDVDFAAKINNATDVIANNNVSKEFAENTTNVNSVNTTKVGYVNTANVDSVNATNVDSENEEILIQTADKKRYRRNVWNDIEASKWANEVRRRIEEIAFSHQKSEDDIYADLYSFMNKIGGIDALDIVKQCGSNMEALKLFSMNTFMCQVVREYLNTVSLFNKKDKEIPKTNVPSNRYVTYAAAHSTPAELKMIAEKFAAKNNMVMPNAISVFFRRIGRFTGINISEMAKRYAAEIGVSHCSQGYYIYHNPTLMDAARKIAESN